MTARRILTSLLYGLIPLAMAASAAAQPAGTAATGYGREIQPGIFRPDLVPPLFFREEWKAIPGKPIEHPVEQGNVANPNLELTLWGPYSKDIQKNGGAVDASNPIHIWTGLTLGASGLTLRDRANYVDLTGGAMIRWYVWVNGVHHVYPLIRLADGTLLMGDLPSGTLTAWHAAEVSIRDVHWFRLDSMDFQGRKPGTERPMVTRGSWQTNVDLSKVDAVGFMDPIAGSGHQIGGALDVGWIEVYGKPVKR